MYLAKAITDLTKHHSKFDLDDMQNSQCVLLMLKLDLFHFQILEV